MEFMEILLPAIGIGTIAAAIIGYLGTHRKNQIDGITAERTRWREELRKISDDLYVAPLKDTERYIQQLELHINSYGISHQWDYMRDGHIWNLLDVMRNNIDAVDFTELKNNKKVLNKYISVLLKHDWERSKAEIKGEPSSLLMWFTAFIFCSFDIYSIRTWFFDESTFLYAVQTIMSYFALFLSMYIFTRQFTEDLWLSKKAAWGIICEIFYSLGVCALVFIWVFSGMYTVVLSPYFSDSTNLLAVPATMYIKMLLGIVLIPLWTNTVLRKRSVNQNYYQEIHVLIKQTNKENSDKSKENSI